MKAKEKAIELYKKYGELNKLAFNKGFSRQKAIDCALIAVDEILSINNERMYQLTGVKESFYKEVKEELKKLPA